MLNASEDLAAVLQALKLSESTLERWRKQYGGMKSEEAIRLKKLEDENKRLKQLVPEKVGVEALYIEPGSPWRNGCDESLHRRFRNEFL